MKSHLLEIRERFFAKARKPIDFTIFHHRLMKEYGWIPLEEFKKLPIPTLFNLLNHILEDEKAEELALKKAMTKRR